MIGVSQYGSEADTFARVALAMAGLKPDKDTTLIQLGGHPQVAASLALCRSLDDRGSMIFMDG